MHTWIKAAGLVAAGWFVVALGCTPPPKIEKSANAPFVGSAACLTCHPDEFTSWKKSWHSRIVRPTKGAILSEAVDKWASDGEHRGPRVGNGTGGDYKLADVQFVIGSRWKQLYLVKNDTTGNLQFLDKQFNRATGKWEDYRQKSDWDTTCATCHTTGYRITAYDQQSGRTLKSTFTEMGVGCEACHGPGGLHVTSQRAGDIFNPANADIKMQSKLCGYCHARVENRKWLSAQGEPREDLPAPNPGETYLAGDDWTLWYPQQVTIPGVQPENSFTREYAGQLQGMFMTDEFARSHGIYEEALNRQQYQGFIQSAHYQSGTMSCITCHASHGHKGKIKKVPQNACYTCHDDSYTVDKYMPNTGMTANSLFVRSHTFSKTPRKGATNPGKLAEPSYYGN